MKKIMTLLLVMLMAFSFVGCKGKETQYRKNNRFDGPGMISALHMKFSLLSNIQVHSVKGEIAHLNLIGNPVKIPEEPDLLAAVRRLVGPEIF